MGPFHCTFAKRFAGYDRIIVGIQQVQQTNRFAIVAWTWNHVRRNQVYQLAEAVTEFDADPLEHEWLKVCAAIRSEYHGGSIEFIRSADGSSDQTNDALRFSHGIQVKSTIKTSGGVKARVQRLADLFDLGIAKVIAGSALAEDLAVSRWNAKSKKAKKWELDDTQRSPDVAIAGTNAFDLPSYTQIGGMKPPAPKLSFEDRLAAEQKKTLDALYSGKGDRSAPRSTYETLWLPPPKI